MILTRRNEGAKIDVRAGARKLFVPDEFNIPSVFQNNKFYIMQSVINDLVEDYTAVMGNVEHLQGTFGGYSNWPSYDLTLEQNLIDLGWHHKEFQNRSSFAYAVRNPDKTEYMGCVYLYPSTQKGYDVDVYGWLIKSACDRGLFSQFKQTVKSWLKEWPFKKPYYYNFEN